MSAHDSKSLANPPSPNSPLDLEPVSTTFVGIVSVGTTGEVGLSVAEGLGVESVAVGLGVAGGLSVLTVAGGLGVAVGFSVAIDSYVAVDSVAVDSTIASTV